MGPLRIAALTTALVSRGASAAPWVEAGDAQLRQDIEMLHAAGHVRGPINAWPLPWAQLEVAPELPGTSLAPHLAAARRRMERQRQRATAARTYEAFLRATNTPELVRDFSDAARREADVGLRLHHAFGPAHVTIAAGYRPGARGTDVHADGSYAALTLGNWAVYGGYVEQWWGPGHDGALLFSTSARPFPKIGVKRLLPLPIDLPLLRWLGPVRADLFVGALTEERDFPNTGVVGMRLGLEPIGGLEIGFNRALQLCGRGRPCTPSMMTRALVAIGDQDNTGTPDEPGNQLAGLDLSYTLSLGDLAVQVYYEAEAEDENNLLIELFAQLGGMSLTGPLGASGASWQTYIEYTDTRARKLLGGPRRGTMYNHFIYTDGFTYQRRPLGYALDGDTRALVLSTAVNDGDDSRWYGTVRLLDVNVTADPRYRISKSHERIFVFTAGLATAIAGGEILVETRLQHDGPNTPAARALTAQVELGWTLRF